MTCMTGYAKKTYGVQYPEAHGWDVILQVVGHCCKAYILVYTTPDNFTNPVILASSCWAENLSSALLMLHIEGMGEDHEQSMTVSS